LLLAEYNLLVTSEIGLPDQQIYDTCHNLWPLEAFRIMKSDLDARPVFLRKKGNDPGPFSDLLSDRFAGEILSNENSEELVLSQRDLRILS